MAFGFCASNQALARDALGLCPALGLIAIELCSLSSTQLNGAHSKTFND